ncbi:MAG: hypothetical protein N2Z21_10495 [Candidatus Sumerlaeaceae bacterium]|nr:hypothetical protein [Candidatus Sumerlaeaceae bacterium]
MGKVSSRAALCVSLGLIVNLVTASVSAQESASTPVTKRPLPPGLVKVPIDMSTTALEYRRALLTSAAITARSQRTTEPMAQYRRTDFTTGPRRIPLTTMPLSRRVMTTAPLAPSQQIRELHKRAAPPPMSAEALREFVTPTSAPKSLERVISLLHSSNRRSTVETCSCPAHPLGGFDREARVIEEVGATKQPCIYVDAGGYTRLPPNARSLKGAAIALEAITAMGVHAVNVGSTDLTAGLSFFRDLETSFSVPFVSANIMDSKGKALFPAHRTVQVKLLDGSKLKVALVGVTRLSRDDESTSRTGGVPKEFTLAQPKPILDKLIPELRKKSDLVILLAYYTREDAPTLVASLDPSARPDVVVCGEFTIGQRKEYYLDNAHKVDGVLYLTGGYEGRQLGHAMFTIGKKNGVAEFAAKLIEIEQSIPPKKEFTHFVERYQKQMAELMMRGE